ncbi:MAG: NAD(P)H-dependent oxidoreductase subunit E, partial [Caldilineaceae bacterium]|nr:NAD(P)H-dependent oxidoreductase subunit E [Caldilineaceae bacterium]
MREKLAEIRAIEEEARSQFSHTVSVCTAAGCLSSGAAQVKEALGQEIERSGLEHGCRVKGVGCLGLCSAGPLVAVESQATMYGHVAVEDAPAIVSALNSQPVKRLQLPTDAPFFQRQSRIVLENSGRIDPERIEEYIAAQGYSALVTALTEMTPAQVIEEVTTSGLRGRGGGGYPTGLKWATVAKAPGPEKYIICNADEGDPGAFMDRSVLESDPHRVIEGMILAGYAVGASQGYVYVRAEYPLAIAHLKKAISQARRLGLLGRSVAETTFGFNIDIRLGAGAFVCGEETALIASIEGKRGQPRPRPPYPAEYGLWGKSTLINNVESFANIPPIIRKGGGWYTTIGTEKSKGTKVFALAGAITNTGIIEVPMGTSLREIVYDIGGGVPNGGRCKAVQTGGPSGGCIPDAYLDNPVDYDSLSTLGSIMGSGGMIVMDGSSCMVDVAKYFMEFCMTESCGKCVPCRVGTVQMHRLLDKIATGRASLDDLALLEELCDMVKHTSLCGLGQTAPNPVVSTLRYFRDEYLAHIEEKRCPAGVCKIHNPVRRTDSPTVDPSLAGRTDSPTYNTPVGRTGSPTVDPSLAGRTDSPTYNTPVGRTGSP